jgi:hypothetical protein
MTANNIRQGACLCGAVRIRAGMNHTDLGACHCSICLKWSGGPFMELECGSNVEFEGAESIQTYESSRWAVRGFCKNCGSHLYIKEKSSNSYGVPVGLFSNDVGISFNRQVFIDKKPLYYGFSNPTRDISSDTVYEIFPEAKESKL